MKNIFIKYGIIYAIVSIGIGLLNMYNVTGMGISTLLSFGAFLLILVLAGIEYKKKNEGFASFGTLVKLFFGIICISIVLATLTQIVIVSFLKEETKTQMVQKIVDSQVSMYEAIGMDEVNLIELEDKLMEKAESMFQASTYLMNSLISIIMLVVISLIPAAILKKSGQ